MVSQPRWDGIPICVDNGSHPKAGEDYDGWPRHCSCISTCLAIWKTLPSWEDLRLVVHRSTFPENSCARDQSSWKNEICNRIHGQRDALNCISEKTLPPTYWGDFLRSVAWRLKYICRTYQLQSASFFLYSWEPRGPLLIRRVLSVRVQVWWCRKLYWG